MAGGTFEFAASGPLQGKIEWSSVSNGSAANTSTVKATLYARRTDSYGPTKGRSWSGWVHINGVGANISFSSSVSVGTSWVTMATTTQTIAHNDDGTKVVGIDGAVKGPSGTALSGNESKGSGNATLDRIDRKLTINSLEVIYKTMRTIKVRWSTSHKRSGTYYSLDNGATWKGAGDYEEIFDNSNQTSGTFLVSNLEPNTKYNFKVKFIRADNGLETESGILTATTYDYPKLTSVPNVNIGSAHTITWSNPSNAAASLTLYKNADTSKKIEYGAVTGTSKQITPTASTIYGWTPSANSVVGKYTLTSSETIKINGANNTRTFSHSATFTFYVTNSNPTFSNFTYADTNSTTTALTGNNQILVNGYSKVTATISTANKASPKNGASIVKYRLVIGNSQVEANYSSTANVSLTISNITSQTMTIYAIDSRGNSTAKTISASTYKAYSNIAITGMTVTRGDGGIGTQATLNITGRIWNASFGSVTNAINTISYKYRNTNTSTWTSGATALKANVSGNTFSLSTLIQGDLAGNGFSQNSSFYVMLSVSDKLKSTDYTFLLGAGTPLIAMHKNGIGIKGLYNSTLGGAVQVNGVAYIDRLGTGSNHYRMGSQDTILMPPQGQETAAWWLAASGKATGYANNHFLLSITGGFNKGCGLLYANIRCSNESTLSVYQFRWLASTGDLKSNWFRIKCDGNNWYLYCYTPAYVQYHITVLRQGSNGGPSSTNEVMIINSPKAGESVSEPTGNGVWTSSNSGISGMLESIDGRISNANISHKYENDRIHLQLLQSSASMTSNKPNNDGFIMHCSWDNSGEYNAQLFLPNDIGKHSVQFRGCAGGTWGNWEDMYRSKILYGSTTGTTGTVTLTETAANFKKLQIFYRNNDNYYHGQEVYDPNGKTIMLMSSYPDSSGWLNTSAVKVSGTSITVSKYYHFNGLNSNLSQELNCIYITGVVGYR